jgi:hypothetical protein
MIEFCEYTLLDCQNSNGNIERICFPAELWANIEPISGDLHVRHLNDTTKPGQPIVGYICQTFRCPFCNLLFVITDIDQLRHEECPQTMRRPGEPYAIPPKCDSTSESLLRAWGDGQSVQ